MSESSKKIIEELTQKLSSIDVPEDIKKLYYQKIKLLGIYLTNYQGVSTDEEIYHKINSLYQELNSLKHHHNYLNNKIDNYNRKLEKNKKMSNSLRERIITYLLILSMLLTASTYIYEREKKKGKEVLYLTDRYVKCDTIDYEDNVTEYLPKTDSEAIYIQRITPWNIEKSQGERTIYTYQITNMTVEELLMTEDYTEIVRNLDFTIEKEYKYKNEMRSYDRYDEPIYQVVYQKQNSNDYIVEYPNLSKTAIALVLSNILIYLLMVSINKGPLVESLICDIMKLNQDNKDIDIDYQIIKTYTKKK